MAYPIQPALFIAQTKKIQNETRGSSTKVQEFFEKKGPIPVHERCSNTDARNSLRGK